MKQCYEIVFTPTPFINHKLLLKRLNWAGGLFAITLCFYNFKLVVLMPIVAIFSTVGSENFFIGLKGKLENQYTIEKMLTGMIWTRG